MQTLFVRQELYIYLLLDSMRLELICLKKRLTKRLSFDSFANYCFIYTFETIFVCIEIIFFQNPE
jgi:hypothetical protein